MRHWISAPTSDSQLTSGGVIGVWLEGVERVEWVYTIMPDGRRVVTGYDILPALSLRQEKLLKDHTCEGLQ